MEPRCTKTYFVAGGRVERECGELAEFFCAECGKARCEEHGDETFEEVNGRVLCEDCVPTHVHTACRHGHCAGCEGPCGDCKVELLHEVVGHLKADAGITDAFVEEHIACVMVPVAKKYTLVFGTANECWGADIAIDGVPEPEGIATALASTCADASEIAMVLTQAAMRFDQHVSLARKAIEDGKTMGQFIRELPNQDDMTMAELQEYGKAYALARKGGRL